MSLLAWLTLSLTNGLGPVLSRRLVDAFGNADDAARATAAQLNVIDGIGSVKASSIAASLSKARDEAQRELDRAAAMNVELVCIDDDRYPALLKTVHGPPGVIYVRGTLEPRDLHAVAIVGSRKCSVYGREQAERFGANLAGVGVTVISGGARGIDTYAHKGALVPKNGRTIAVLGTGLDVAYPPENKDLFAQIAGQGAVISDFPLGTPPVPENFPRRNRIVSALSRGVLVVEADVRSGALITARIAADDHNRPVFAIPGRVDNPLSAGPHKLIRDGAVLAENVGDVIDNLGPLPGQTRDANPTVPTLFDEPAADAPRQAGPPLSARQQTIVAALKGETLDVDRLADRTQLSPGVVLQEMTLLSLRGVVKRVEGQSFALK
jgi:DNA processing protein